MAVYTVIDPATGTILRSGSIPDQDLHMQAGPGEVVLDELYRDDQHQVGQVTTTGMHFRRRPAPKFRPDTRGAV